MAGVVGASVGVVKICDIVGVPEMVEVFLLSFCLLAALPPAVRIGVDRMDVFCLGAASFGRVKFDVFGVSVRLAVAGVDVFDAVAWAASLRSRTQCYNSVRFRTIKMEGTEWNGTDSGQIFVPVSRVRKRKMCFIVMYTSQM